MNRRLLSALWGALMATTVGPVHADEGMWTFENAPIDQIRARHGIELTPAWLDHLRLASVQVSGASGSFVSSRGLLLTNHHVVEGCLARLSTPQRDLLTHGFLARQPREELACPGFVARVLQRSEDVTPRVQQAVQAAGGEAAAKTAARQTTIAALEAGCSQPAQGTRCEVVTLYQGAQYQLYHFRVWDDVRLVWAPEAQAGFFGGDPDNFVYPRFALDAALMRVYEHGQPVTPAAVLHLAQRMPAEGEPLFVAGHPGRTSRLLTVAQLEVLRDFDYPIQLATARAELKALHAYAGQSPEAARQSQDVIFGTENWLKSRSGEYDTLRDPAVMAAKQEDEQRLRAAVAQRGLPGRPWSEVGQAMQVSRALAAELWGLNPGHRTMLDQAEKLVTLAHERGLAEGERLPDFRDAAVPDIERELLAHRPFYPALETVRLQTTLERAIELLGPAHPYVQAALAGQTPAQAAARLISGTRLGDPAERARLVQGGAAAVDASDDPLIALARGVYPLQRAVQWRLEREVQTPVRQAADIIGQARFALFGHTLPPDATKTLRLSFGPARGYSANGLNHPWKTTWGGWWDRADSFDGREPYTLAPSIERARGQIDARTPLDFVLTADIIGGNSGSPVVNAQGEWVGLIFDGNLEGLGGAFVYQDSTARALAVHAQAILAALEKAYGAPQLAAEIKGSP